MTTDDIEIIFTVSRRPDGSITADDYFRLRAAVDILNRDAHAPHFDNTLHLAPDGQWYAIPTTKGL